MERRKFLSTLGASLLAGPVLLKVTACATDSDPGEVRPGGGSPGGSSGDPGTTSGFIVNNADVSHRHEFTLRCEDQGAGEQVYVATGSGHTHEVLLSEQDLLDIFEGRQVIVETTDLHPHTWSITMPTTGCTDIPNSPDPDPGGNPGGDPGGGW